MSNKAKRADTRPARKRYWTKRALESRKIKNLVKYCRMNKQSAYNLWHKTRRTRVPDGYIDRHVG